MEKFIPYEKLSKKEKRSRDLSRRNTWGQLNPVTRKPKTARHIAGAKPGIGSVTRTNQFRACIYWEIILFLNKMISSFYERRFTADRLVGGKKCIDFVF